MLRQCSQRHLMTKKLTKALRGKRRWIGCICHNFDSRSDLEKHIETLPVKIYGLLMSNKGLHKIGEKDVRDNRYSEHMLIDIRKIYIREK